MQSNDMLVIIHTCILVSENKSLDLPPSSSLSMTIASDGESVKKHTHAIVLCTIYILSISY